MGISACVWLALVSEKNLEMASLSALEHFCYFAIGHPGSGGVERITSPVDARDVA